MLTCLTVTYFDEFHVTLSPLIGHTGQMWVSLLTVFTDHLTVIMLVLPEIYTTYFIPVTILLFGLILYISVNNFSVTVNSVRNKQLPTCPSRVEFAGGKLKVTEGCPLDNLKFQKIILFRTN